MTTRKEPDQELDPSEPEPQTNRAALEALVGDDDDDDNGLEFAEDDRQVQTVEDLQRQLEQDEIAALREAMYTQLADVTRRSQIISSEQELMQRFQGPVSDAEVAGAAESALASQLIERPPIPPGGTTIEDDFNPGGLDAGPSAAAGPSAGPSGVQQPLVSGDKDDEEQETNDEDEEPDILEEFLNMVDDASDEEEERYSTATIQEMEKRFVEGSFTVGSGSGMANLEDAGRTAAAQEMWKLWIQRVKNLRVLDKDGRFVRARNLQEDLLIGPRDGPRLMQAGFERAGPRNTQDPHQIVWAIQRDTSSPELVDITTLTDEFVATLSASTVIFFPRRKMKRTGTRSGRAFPAPGQTSTRTGRAFQGGSQRKRKAVMGIVTEDPEVPGMAEMEPIPRDLQSKLKYMLKDGKRVIGPDGKPVLIPRNRPAQHVTEVLRLQFLPIRLNSSHWEWCYVRWLENETMFEPAAMTPYLHNTLVPDLPMEKRGVPGLYHAYHSQFLDSAVPLLTRGSMNFYGVGLRDADVLVISQMADCTRDTVRERCHRVHFWSTQPTFVKADLPGMPREQKVEFIYQMDNLWKLMEAQLTKGDNQLEKDGVICHWMGNADKALSWETIFEVVIDKDDRRKNEYYQNYIRCERKVASDACKVSGYGECDEGYDGTNAEGLGAFLGRPWYKRSGEQAVGTNAAKPAYLLDVRGYDYNYQDPGSLGKNVTSSIQYRLYGQKFREFMFKPMPIKSLQTLPPADAVFQKEADRNTTGHKQLPAYLNLHMQKSRTSEDTLQEESLTTQAEVDAWKRTDAATTSVPMPRPPKGMRAEMDQRYPEVIMSKTYDFKTRYSNMTTFFRKKLKGLDAAEKQTYMSHHPELSSFADSNGNVNVYPTPESMDGMSDEGKKDIARAARASLREKFVASPKVAGMLAPTTLRETLGRYVEENRRSMAWTRTKSDGTNELLDTSPSKINRAKGVYYSCRFDVGTQSGQGGLDSFFPASQDATVYQIADVMLARGVHDYVRKPGRDTRAGPPSWWKVEDDLMNQDPTTLGSVLAEDQTPAMAWPNIGQQPALMQDEAGNELKVWRGLKESDIAYNRITKIKFANGLTKMPGSKSRGAGGLKYVSSSLVFDDFKPYEAEPKGRRPPTSLPHTVDATMQRMCMYPNRLGLRSKQAVFRRWLENERALDTPGGTFEVVDTDEEQPEKKSTPRRIKGTVGTRSSNTLVVPCYVLALEFDDFTNAVQKGELEWAELFKKFYNYWEYADMLMIERLTHVDGSITEYLVYNPDYVTPDMETPPRAEGDWETYDGPPKTLLATPEGREEYKYCIRPKSRTRASWMQDKRAFGAKDDPQARPPRTTCIDFMKRVARFEQLYRQRDSDKRLFNSLTQVDGVLSQVHARLRQDGLRLTWDLARLQSGQKLPKTLFQADLAVMGRLTLQDDLRLHTAKVRSIDTRQNWRFDLQIVIMLMDMAHGSTRVRESITSFQEGTKKLEFLRASGKTVPEAGRSLETSMEMFRRVSREQSVRLTHVEDLLRNGGYKWPSMDDIDTKLAPGGARIANLLHELVFGSLNSIEGASAQIALVNKLREQIKSVTQSLIHQKSVDEPNPFPTEQQFDPCSDYNCYERLKQTDPVKLGNHQTKRKIIVEAYKSFTAPRLAASDTFPEMTVGTLLQSWYRAHQEEEDVFHPLQRAVTPVFQLILDVWADHLVQLRISDIAPRAALQLRTEVLHRSERGLPSDETFEFDGLYAPDKIKYKAHFYLLGQHPQLTGAFHRPELEPQNVERIYPLALQPAGLRAPRGISGQGPRDAFQDLDALKWMMMYKMTEKLQYHRQLELVSRLVEIEKQSDERERFGLQLQQPENVHMRVIEATANAFATAFPKMVKEGQPLEAFWKLIQGKPSGLDGLDLSQQSANNVLLAFVDMGDVTFDQLPKLVRQGADVAVTLLRRRKQVAAAASKQETRVAAMEQRNLKWREHRMRGAFMLVSTLNATLSVTLRAKEAANDAQSQILSTQIEEIRSLTRRTTNMLAWLKTLDAEQLASLRTALRKKARELMPTKDKRPRTLIADDVRPAISIDTASLHEEQNDGVEPGQLQRRLDAAEETISTAVAGGASDAVDQAITGLLNLSQTVLSESDSLLTDNENQMRSGQTVATELALDGVTNIDQVPTGQTLVETPIDLSKQPYLGVKLLTSTLKELETDALNTWKAARKEELMFADELDRRAQEQEALVAFMAYLVNRTRPALLDELNTELEGVSSGETPGMTAADYEAFFAAVPDYSTDIPDIPKFLPPGVSHWSGYRLYIANLLHLEIEDGKERWFFKEVPLTPRQWLVSPLSQDSYPEEFTTTSIRRIDELENGSRHRRVEDTLQQMTFDEEELKTTLYDIVDQQHAVSRNHALVTPFAWEFGAVL